MSDDVVSINDVNEAMVAAGLDPEAVREFAFELVMQTLTDDLPSAVTLREIELGKRLRLIINRLDDGKAATRNTLAGILQSIAAELDIKRHKAKGKAG